MISLKSYSKKNLLDNSIRLKEKKFKEYYTS